MLAKSHKDAIAGIFLRLINDVPDRIQPITLGVMTYKYEVSVRKKKYIIRFYPQGREHIVAFEPDVIRKCRAMDMKVPMVYTDSRSEPKFVSDYMIYEFVKGRPLSSQLAKISRKQIRAVCEEVVEAIDRMARIKIDGFGELVSENRGTDASWADFVKTSFRRGLTARPKTPFCSKEQLGKLELLCKELDHKYAEVDGRLVYSDLRPENIILAPDMKLAAIVDFEGVLSGDPLLSLGYCYAACGDNLFFSAMEKCWAKRIGPIDRRRLDVYAILRIMRIAEHIDKPLPVGKRRDPIEKTFPGFFKSLNRIELAT